MKPFFLDFDYGYHKDKWSERFFFLGTIFLILAIICGIIGL